MVDKVGYLQGISGHFSNEIFWNVVTKVKNTR